MRGTAPSHFMYGYREQRFGHYIHGALNVSPNESQKSVHVSGYDRSKAENEVPREGH